MRANPSSGAEREQGADAALRQLLAKDAIRQVLHTLTRGQDRLDRDAITSGYWPDAIDDHGVFRGSPPEFADFAIAALAQFAASHHVLGQSDIVVEGDVAHSETYVHAHHVSNAPDGTITDDVEGLRYLDRFERRAVGETAEWRIARRTLVWDWSYRICAGDARALPDGCTLGRRDKEDFVYDWLSAAAVGQR